MEKLLLCSVALATAVSVGAVSNPFKWTPAPKDAPQQWTQFESANADARLKTVTEPTATLPPSHSTGFVDSPSGVSWYYTVDYDQEILSQNEYYVDYSIQGVHIKVYDEARNYIGAINASWERPEDVSRIQTVQIGAVATKKFFDSSDNYELMLMLNYNPVNGYGAKQETKVYSLTPEGDGECLVTLPGYYISAVNTAQDAWSENYFILFIDNSTWPDEDTSMANFTLYKKAGWNGAPSALQSWDLNLRYSYSDGENEGMPIIMNGVGTTLYVATALYEKTFFANPDDYEDETLSPDNNYVITLYKSDWGSLSEVATTKIPVEDPDEGFFMRTYCVGQFLGARDMTFDFNNKDEELPKYIIRVNQTTVNEEETQYFAAYDQQGNEVKRWGEGSVASLHLCPIRGQEEQFVFSTLNGYETLNYPSLTQGATLPTSIVMEDGNEWPYSGSLDRTPVGGSYKYAISFLNGDEDEEGNTIHRIAWYNADGTLDRLDALNLGPNVARAQVYIAGNVLNPHLLNSDDAQEYVVYVSRLLSDDSSATQLHLMVTDATGQPLADIPFALDTSNIMTQVVNTDNRAALFYYYYDLATELYIPSFIDLPLNDFEGEGTVDKPYLIASAGDMDRVRFNLDKSFKLAKDIHYDGAYMQIVGSANTPFTGTFDGAGHAIVGPTIASSSSSVAMFISAGNYDPKGETQPVYIRNLVIESPRVLLNGNNNGNASVLVGEAMSTTISNITVADPIIEVTDGTPKCDVGVLMGEGTLNTIVQNCEVRGANVAVPSAYNMGGIAQNLKSGASIKNCQFTGSLSGGKNVGGIIATTADMATQAAPGSIKDCRVDAELKGKANVGGIIGYSPRVPITRCIFSGSLQATEVQTGYFTETSAPYDYLSVGGIAGHLTRAFVTAPDVITDCAVDIKDIQIPSDASEQARQTVHRLIGWSSANDEPEILSQKYNPSTGDYDYTYGDPAPAESRISDNYAVNEYPAGDSALATSTGVDGADMARKDMGKDFFQGLGYNFSNLWSINGQNLPFLFGYDGPVVAIQEMDVDNATNAPAGYYDLLGRRVLDPRNGIFIKVQGGKATKVRL